MRKEREAENRAIRRIKPGNKGDATNKDEPFIQ